MSRHRRNGFRRAARREAYAYKARRRHVDEGDFEFALDLILDGVERIMDRA